MKKFIFITLLAFLMLEASSQSNIRFENRKTDGYFNLTQIGLMMGNQPINENTPNYFDDRSDFHISPSVTMVNGIMFNEERWSAGLGVGFEIFDRSLFPVFFDLRRTFWASDVSPYIALKTGYSISGFKKKPYENFMLNHDPYMVSDIYFKKHGGFMFNPEIGVKIVLSENADLLITAAYRHQRTKSKVTRENRNPREWEYKLNMNRLSFGVGIMFR